MIPTVICVAGDPGGANALIPVLRQLRADNRVQLTLLAYRQAVEQWAGQNFDFTQLSEETSAADCAAMLAGDKPRLLLAGTSVNGVDLERKFIAAAREVSVPSLAVLDFWSNYRRRFENETGQLVLPDRLAIMDERAREEMVEAGFDAANLSITGQPAFDELLAWKDAFDGRNRASMRQQIGVGDEELLVLFATDPMGDIYGEDLGHPEHPGYTEHTVMAELLPSLEHLAQKFGRSIVLLIRPHPRETVAKYAATSSASLRILVSQSEHPWEIAMAADLVAGMNSIYLMHAAYLGRVVVSLQPGLKTPDCLPTNHTRLTRPVYRSTETEPVLEQALRDVLDRKPGAGAAESMLPVAGAAGRVSALVYEMLGLPRDPIGALDEYRCASAEMPAN